MVSKQKILIVDDDNNIAELISLYLTNSVLAEAEMEKMIITILRNSTLQSTSLFSILILLIKETNQLTNHQLFR